MPEFQVHDLGFRGATFDMVSDQNNQVIQWGKSASNRFTQDHKFFGSATTSYVHWDASADTMFFVEATLVFGHSATVTISDGDGAANLIPAYQFLGAAKADSSILLASFNATDNATVAPSLNFLKSGNATIGSNTIVANSEIVGQLQFFGADGTDFESPGARIHAAVDGTPGVGDMPMKLVFSTTPDGSETLAARLTISAEGLLTVAASTAPASVATATGTDAGAILTMTGGVGGASSNASGTGGIGGGVSITAGAGGVASGATAATGGAGGAWAFTTGAGGASSVATVTSTGGAGGAITWTSGAGGASSGAVSGTATGGASGALIFASGTGGATTATTGTNVGGASGAVSYVSGTGGAASGATDTGGESGAATYGSGIGGSSDTGGASGVVLLKSGTGGAGTGTGGASGNVIVRTGAAGSGGSPTVGSILFEPGAVETARMTGLKVFIGDNADAGITQGLCISQGASDDIILSLKSSDVGHATTGSGGAEADTYGAFAKAEDTSGGLLIRGFKDGDGVAGHALHLRGVLDETAADTTKSTAGIGVVTIDGCLEGTNVPAVVGSDENLVVIRNLATTRFIFDGEGSAHGDVEFVAFDEHDDVALLDAMEHEFAVRRGDELKMNFGAFAQEHKDALQKHKVVNFYDKTGKRGMVNFTRLAMLHTGAIRQLSGKLNAALDALGAATERLGLAEAKLAAISG